MLSLHGLAAELEAQTRRAMELELEKKRAREEAQKLDGEKRTAKEAMSALVKQAEDQQKNQEHLVGPRLRRPSNLSESAVRSE